MSAVKKILEEHPFLNTKIITSFSNGVIQTLKTMASIDCIFSKTFVEKNWKSKNDISVYLDLKSTEHTGRIYFHFNKNVLVEMYQKMIGEKIDNESSEILDCIGELSNICYGYAKAELSEKKLNLEMSLPHPCKTKDLPEVLSKYAHVIMPFEVGKQLCHIQIVIF